jgi:hypothetical protein
MFSPRHALGLLTVGILSLLGSETLSAGDPRVIELPPLSKWERSLADVESTDIASQIVIPINYKTGRVTAPALPANPRELFTFRANVATDYKFKQLRFYQFWLELEFLKNSKIIGTFKSPELAGNAREQSIGVTAVAPAGTTAVRVSFCGVNKLWAVVDNSATVRYVELLRLSGHEGQISSFEVASPLPKSAGSRNAKLVAKTTWPEQAAINVVASKGKTPTTVYVHNGALEVPIEYAEGTVGSTDVVASIGSEMKRLTIQDPRAAVLRIDHVAVDGRETPVLVQLTQGSVMMPGRYQAAMAGIFITPPWSIELAPGDWHLRICRGPHVTPWEKGFTAVSGKTTNVSEVLLQRPIDLRREGWFSGDADGDVYHGERIYTDISAETAAEISQAMGLEWVGVANWGSPKPKTWSEANTATASLTNDHLLFLWTDEKPKSQEGHICFVGMARPEAEPFGWGWLHSDRTLRNHEILHAIRAHGAATFVNHPLRWWVTNGRFRSNMYSSLPFDLCAARLIDGLNINEGDEAQVLWSMLLDHGYRVAATAGADFGLDRPEGPIPGIARMYCHCPEGLSSSALAEAVRKQRTIVSTGPTLVADINGLLPGSTVDSGKTYRVTARAWPRADLNDPLLRVELWAHGRAQESKSVNELGSYEFVWKPKGDWDWVAVKAVSKRGWAMTSAFYATQSGWQEPGPVNCELTIKTAFASKSYPTDATIEVWNNVPSLAGSELLSKHELKPEMTINVPVTATIVVQDGKGIRQEHSVFATTGLGEFIDAIAEGEEREKPLLDWNSYTHVLEKCKRATLSLRL